jgi:hypothetical protein
VRIITADFAGSAERQGPGSSRQGGRLLTAMTRNSNGSTGSIVLGKALARRTVEEEVNTLSLSVRAEQADRVRTDPIDPPHSGSSS